MFNQYVSLDELPRWDYNYYELAHFIAARWSKDPRRKVGAVLVGTDRRDVSLGVNGFPPGWVDGYLADRDFKNRWVLHAEQNAVHRARFSLALATAYITCPPCTQCAAILESVGVQQVICPTLDPDSSWYEQHKEVLDSNMHLVLVNGSPFSV